MTTQEVPAWVPVCKTSQVRSGEGRQFRPAGGRLNGKPVAVWNDNGTFYATNFICPHMGGPLSDGVLRDGVIECPWHGWTYYVETGLPAGDQEAPGKGVQMDHGVSAYECRVEGDDVMIGGMRRPVGS